MRFVWRRREGCARCSPSTMSRTKRCAASTRAWATRCFRHGYSWRSGWAELLWQEQEHKTGAERRARREQDPAAHVRELPDGGGAERTEHRAPLGHRADDAEHAAATARRHGGREGREPRRVVRGQRGTGDEADRVEERARQIEEQHEAEQEDRDRRE